MFTVYRSQSRSRVGRFVYCIISAAANQASAPNMPIACNSDGPGDAFGRSAISAEIVLSWASPANMACKKSDAKSAEALIRRANFRKYFLQIAFAVFHNVLRTRFLRQLQRHTVSGQRIVQLELVARLQNFNIDSVDCIGQPLAGRKNAGRGFIDPIPCIGGERCLDSTA
jgi:hypothetical protein